MVKKKKFVPRGEPTGKEKTVEGGRGGGGEKEQVRYLRPPPPISIHKNGGFQKLVVPVFLSGHQHRRLKKF